MVLIDLLQGRLYFRESGSSTWANPYLKFSDHRSYQIKEFLQISIPGYHLHPCPEERALGVALVLPEADDWDVAYNQVGPPAQGAYCNLPYGISIRMTLLLGNLRGNNYSSEKQAFCPKNVVTRSMREVCREPMESTGTSSSTSTCPPYEARAVLDPRFSTLGHPNGPSPRANAGLAIA